MKKGGKINYCPVCGEKLKGTEKYCQACGANLTNSEIGTVNEVSGGDRENILQNKIDKRNRKKHGFWKKMMVIAGSIILLVIVLSLVSGDSNSDRTKEQMDLLENAYLLPEEFGKEKKVVEALATLGGKEKYDFGEDVDGVVAIEYFATTVWGDENVSVKLNLSLDTANNVVTPINMYMKAKEMPPRFMEAYLYKCEGFDAMSEALLRDYSNGKTDSYIEEMRQDREELQKSVIEAGQQFKKELQEVSTEGIIKAPLDEEKSGTDSMEGMAENGVESMNESEKVSVRNVISTQWTKSPDEECSFQLLGDEDDVEIIVFETNNTDNIYFHGYSKQIIVTETADLYITFGYGEAEEIAVMWNSMEMIDYPYLEALNDAFEEYSGDYLYFGTVNE